MTDLFADRTWFAVVAKVRMAEAAAANLDSQGYGTWLPMCLVQRRKNRKWVTVEQPLFPRYLFAGLTTEQAFPPILTTPGVSFVLRDAAGIAIEVPKLALREIKARIDADGGTLDLTPPPPNRRWKKGQILKVEDGPFAGFSGLYQSSANDRIKILLDVLGRSVLATFSAGQVADTSGAPCPAGAVVDAA